MDATETAVITAVVTALGKVVVTETWVSFRTLLGKILGLGDADETVREEEQLQRDRDKIVAAQESGDEDRVNRIAGKWHERLVDFLAEHPDKISSLRALIDATAVGNDVGGLRYIDINNTATKHSGIISAGGDVNITSKG